MLLASYVSILSLSAFSDIRCELDGRLQPLHGALPISLSDDAIQSCQHMNVDLSRGVLARVQKLRLAPRHRPTSSPKFTIFPDTTVKLVTWRVKFYHFRFNLNVRK